MGICEIIKVTTQIFFRSSIKERKFYYERKDERNKKKARENLEQLNLACELARLIRHFFPDLIPLDCIRKICYCCPLEKPSSSLIRQKIPKRLIIPISFKIPCLILRLHCVRQLTYPIPLLKQILIASFF